MKTTSNPVNLNKLKAKIVEKGIRRADLATEMGCSVQALNKKLAGTTQLRVCDMLAFCELLDITDTKEREDIFFSIAN